MQIQATIAAGWIGICVGCAAGAAQGLFFHDENWLGGYNSWARRMLRLGHISLVGLGLLNLAFALSMAALGIAGVGVVANHLDLVGGKGQCVGRRW